MTGKTAPERSLGSPSLDGLILKVMEDCGCSRQRATAALQASNGDVEQAKRHQKTWAKYQARSATSPRLPTSVATDQSGAGVCAPLFSQPGSEETDETTPGSGGVCAGTAPPSPAITPVSKATEISDASLDETAITDWDFILPRLPLPDQPSTTDEAVQYPFDLLNLVRGIQHGASQGDVARYLADYSRVTVEREINDEIKGFPSIFYIVARNDETLLRMWAAHGGNVSAVHGASGVPLVAFVIAQSEMIQQDTTMLLAVLLGLGAPPDAIPPAFYTPYHQDLPVNGPNLQGSGHDPVPVWCTGATSRRLVRTANLGQRYYLNRAARLVPTTTRSRQVAVRKKAQAVLEIPYFLVGQTTASNRLLRKLISHIMIPSERPLVLAFAGPSGHGKTELARRLGYLLSLDLEVVDCAIVNRELELFGPRHPYSGADVGTPLNNFLARHAKQPCIVFLDEFEKTTSDIHQALLLPFDNGEYQDRRNLKTVDCSKTIWIIATNALDDKIHSFCDLHTDIITSDDESRKEQLARQLSRGLKKEFLSHFGGPITGRISEFIPFVPFSEGEQAVIVHKFLRALISRVRAPVSLSTGQDEWLLGDIRLRIRHDASVCIALAKDGYLRELGARSLSGAAKKVEDMLVGVYLEESGEIVERGKGLDVVLSIDGDEVVFLPLHKS